MNFTKECMNQRSDEWLRMRRSYIGASDAPVIMGCSPYMTPYELWLEKLGLGKEREISHAMQRGIDLEAKALAWFNDWTLSEMKPVVRFHRTVPYMMASLDGANENEILEIKCNGYEIHSQVIKGIIPTHHIIQMQHQMEVCGMNECFYVSFDGDRGIVTTVRRMDDLIKQIIEEEAKFWECVTNLVPPTMTEKDRNRVQKDKAVDMSGDPLWNRLVMEMKIYSDSVRESEKKVDEYKEKLTELANGRNCYGSGIRLSKIEKKGSVDYNAIPELKSVDLERYRKPSSSYWKVEECKADLH